MAVIAKAPDSSASCAGLGGAGLIGAALGTAPAIDLGAPFGADVAFGAGAGVEVDPALKADARLVVGAGFGADAALVGSAALNTAVADSRAVAVSVLCGTAVAPVAGPAGGPDVGWVLTGGWMGGRGTGG